MTSVNTNNAAITALRTLQATNSAMDATQNRVSTGLRIGEAKDNAAYWSISTTLKSDNKSLATVKDALSLGAATVDVAYEGLNSAKDVLDEIKAKLTAASQDGVDRSKIQQEIADLQAQLKSISDSAVFAGENWLSVNSADPTYKAVKGIVSGASRDAQNSITISTVDVNIKNVALFDANPAAKGIINSAVALKKDDGTELTIGGVDSSTPAPSKAGLDSAVAVAGRDTVSAAKKAKVSLGIANLLQIDPTDKLTFKMSVDGAPAKLVTIPIGTLTSASTSTNLATQIGTALTDAGYTGLTVAANTTTNEITIEGSSTGSAASLVVTDVKAENGNGTKTGLLGLAVSGLATLGTGTASTTAVGTFAGSTDAAVGDKVNLTFKYNGAVYSTSYTYDATTKNADVGTFKSLMNAAIARATNADGQQLGADKIQLKGTTTLTLETVATGPGQSVALLDVSTLAADGTATAVPSATSPIARGLVKSTASTPGDGTTASVSLAGTSWATTTALKGDRVAFDITLAHEANGSVTSVRKTIEISTDDLTGTVATDDDIIQARLQTALDTAFGTNMVTAAAVSGTGVTLTTVGKGAKESILVNSITALDGNYQTSSVLGLKAGSAVGVDIQTEASATLTTGTAFGAQTFGADDVLSFKIDINGVVRNVRIDQTVVDSALLSTSGYVVGSGTIANAPNFATVMQKALANAGVSGLTVTAIASGADAEKLKFETTAKGSGTVTISDITTSAPSSADTISVDTIDVSDATLARLGVDGSNRKEVLQAYISVVNTALNKVTNAASNLGSVAKRIELQQNFVNTLMDTIDIGVGKLVDADMSEESTRLQALQVKQQLGVQALSMANQTAQQVLRLFQ